MEWAWFRVPAGDDAGTTNLCYNAVDLHVIRGEALAPALTVEGRVLDFAGLLERVAALAGAMRRLGVEPGHRVGIDVADGAEELLTVLACARLGAVAVLVGDEPATRLDEHRPRLLVTDDVPVFGEHVPAACVVRRGEPVDPVRDLPWDLALRAGRTEPAPCQPVAPDTTAYDVDGPVRLFEVTDDVSRVAVALTALVAGRAVSPAGEPRDGRRGSVSP